MQSFRLTVSLLATLLFVSAPAIAADDASASPEAKLQPRGEKITLKLNLPKGTKKKIAYDMNMNMNMNIPQQGPQKMVMAMGFEFDMAVKDVDQKTGDHKIDMTYDRVKMNMDAGPLVMKYDSANKEDANNPLGQQLGVLVGKTITATISPEGKTKKVEGLEKLGPAGQGDQMKQQLEQMFTMYPPKPVDIGDSWSEKRDMAAGPGMNMKAEMKYTLVDRKDGKAIIKMDAKFDAAGQAQLKGTMTGKISINEKTGWTEGGNMDMKMSGNQGGIPLDMKAKITIDGDKKSGD